MLISKPIYEKLEILIASEVYYQRGLHYCVLNNAEKAEFWLNLAARLDHEYAIEVLGELTR